MIGINIDSSELDSLSSFGDAIKDELEKTGQEFTDAVYSKVVEIASQKLHTRLQMYLDNLEQTKDGDVHVISLDAKFKWIEDGLPEHNLIDTVLKGEDHKIIPFKTDPNSQAPSKASAQSDLIGTIKSELGKFGVPFSKIETDKTGKPKIGQLHSFDITRKPLKTAEGPFQGHGPIGQVRQGQSGTPFLQGLKVYQTAGKDTQGNDTVKRSMVTYRVMSQKQRNSGMWDVPAIEGINAFEEAMKWAENEWESTFGPKLIDAIIKTL